MQLTSEERLKELPSIYQTIPADPYNKIESTKEIFSDIIGRIPPESYKKFKIDFDQTILILVRQQTILMTTTLQTTEKKELKIYLKIFKKILKVFFIRLEI